MAIKLEQQHRNSRSALGSNTITTTTTTNRKKKNKNKNKKKQQKASSDANADASSSSLVSVLSGAAGSKQYKDNLRHAVAAHAMMKVVQQVSSKKSSPSSPASASTAASMSASTMYCMPCDGDSTTDVKIKQQPQPQQRSSESCQCCYHGSSKAAYENPIYNDAIFSLETMMDDTKSSELLKDPDFASYLVARAVDVWHDFDLAKNIDTTPTKPTTTTSKSSTTTTTKSAEVGNFAIMFLLTSVLRARYQVLPQADGHDTSLGSSYTTKFHKYMRDVSSLAAASTTTSDNKKDYRGLINVLARETKASSLCTTTTGTTTAVCSCMDPFKQEAKRMDKVGLCYGCYSYFPKDDLRLCSNCKLTKYCSRQCQVRHWPQHKKLCQGICCQQQQ